MLSLMTKYEGSIPVRRRFAITGGAVFTGSSLAKALCRENGVVAIDGLSSGKGEEPVTNGYGTYARDLVCVAGVAKANILAARPGETGGFNVAGVRSQPSKSLSRSWGRLQDAVSGRRIWSPGQGYQDSPADISQAEEIGYFLSTL